MQTTADRPQKQKLSSLTSWSKHHIHKIFEAETDAGALDAVCSTFSEDVNATINGRPITRDNIMQMVLAIRRDSTGKGLKVKWQQTVEVARDPSTNREGSFGGVYIICGIRKMVPGSSQPVEFERHKTVTVTIESQASNNMAIDSRRIVKLEYVASDIRISCQAISML